MDTSDLIGKMELTSNQTKVQVKVQTTFISTFNSGVEEIHRKLNVQKNMPIQHTVIWPFQFFDARARPVQCFDGMC